MMVFGKVYNAKWSVERTRRDHAMRIDEARFSAVSEQLQGLLPQIASETSLDSLRGLEGVGAAAYPTPAISMRRAPQGARGLKCSYPPAW